MMPFSTNCFTDICIDNNRVMQMSKSAFCHTEGPNVHKENADLIAVRLCSTFKKIFVDKKVSEMQTYQVLYQNRVMQGVFILDMV